ncbi:MAG: FkbM family methyltransferase [Edaphocola sp.]
MIGIVKMYARLHGFFHERFAVNIPGLGFLYRQIKKDTVFSVKSKKLYFNHKIADNYGHLINGRFNERETHLFLDRVFDDGKGTQFNFVDIGANVGEFVLDYSGHPFVKSVTAFEPQPEQQKALEATIELNNFKATRLVKSPVSGKEEDILFNFNATNSTASGITTDGSVGTVLRATTIDKEFFDTGDSGHFVFLIDTEGAELSIMKGGEQLIRQNTPLIIFEYNHVTKKHFTIGDVERFLGDKYKVYRLRPDGNLDLNFSNTWNLVAVPQTGYFQRLHKMAV